MNNQFTSLIRQCISANLMTGAFVSNNPVVFCNQLIQSELNQAPIFFSTMYSARLGFSNNPFGLCRQQLQIFIDQLLTQNNNNINNNPSSLQILTNQHILTNNGLTPFFRQSSIMTHFQFLPSLIQPNTVTTPFIPPPLP